MRLYHTTFPESAKAILASRFRDSVGYYPTPSRHRGVWFIDRSEFAPDFDSRRCVWLRLDLPDQLARRNEWVEEGTSYREFLIPARIVTAWAGRSERRMHRSLIASSPRTCPC